mgnify:CR=1 FL=1|jgi:iron complex outermembrane receptor protein
MKSKHLGNFAIRTLPLLISAACATNAFAQSSGVEEVLVSAQKRTERIQDVPMAISAISGQALENRKIEGAADLQGVIPNLNIVAAPVSGLISATSIRGLGTGQPSIWMDPAIGMYVDGVFVGKNQGALFDLVDLERVEVLRGPQGTLFGRNTLGGAVNFVTRQPSGQMSGQVGVEVGNFNRQVQKVSIDTPKINDTLSLTIAGKREKQDGWLNNPNSDEKWGNRDREAFKINAKFDISKDTKIFYSMDRSDINETTTPMSVVKTTGYCSYVEINGCSKGTYVNTFGLKTPGNNDLFSNGIPAWVAGMAAGVIPQVPQSGLTPAQLYRYPANGTALAAALQVGVPTSTSSTVGFNPNQNLKVTGHSLIGETAINPSTSLKYIGSYRKMAYADVGDYDGTAANIFAGVRNTDYSTHSHELQLIGNLNGVNYVGGVYYFKDDGKTVQNQIGSFYSFTLGAVKRGQTNFSVGTEAKAVFGQADFKIDDKTTLTAGLRTTQETKFGSVERTAGANQNYVAGAAYTPVYAVTGSAEAKFNDTTPSAALSYKLDANSIVFGRIAKGFKSGGFPLEAPTKAAALTPFKPEQSTSYEIGTKGANKTASYALTAFVTKLKDQQVSFLPVGSTAPTTTNAGASTYQGIELEGAIRVSADARIQASYGYLDAKFDKYESLGIGGSMVDAASNLVVGYAPKHTFNLNLESNLANTEFGKLKGMVEYRYTAAYSNYPANISMTAANAIPGNLAADSRMPALGIVNARIILDRIPMGGPGQADASLWVKNLGNKQVMQNMMDLSGYYQVGYWSAPRTVGLSVNYKW